MLSINKHFLTIAIFILGLHLVFTYQHLSCKRGLTRPLAIKFRLTIMNVLRMHCNWSLAEITIKLQYSQKIILDKTRDYAPSITYM